MQVEYWFKRLYSPLGIFSRLVCWNLLNCFAVNGGGVFAALHLQDLQAFIVDRVGN